MSRILIVDDDPQLGRSLERVLEREGYTCRVVADLANAIDATVIFKPDVILIELQPEQAPTLSKLQDAVGATPIVFMAGDLQDYARLGALVRPFDDWLAKPAAPQEFIVRVQTVLRRAQPATG
jgi:DNA-binding response OmpR family regulator